MTDTKDYDDKDLIDFDFTEDHVLGISGSDLELLAAVAATPDGLPKATRTPVKPSTPEFSNWAMNRALGR